MRDSGSQHQNQLYIKTIRWLNYASIHSYISAGKTAVKTSNGWCENVLFQSATLTDGNLWRKRKYETNWYSTYICTDFWEINQVPTSWQDDVKLNPWDWSDGASSDTNSTTLHIYLKSASNFKQHFRKLLIARLMSVLSVSDSDRPPTVLAIQTKKIFI